VFGFARRDGAIEINPAASIENAAVQKPVPDPFTLPEVEAILDVSERQVSRLPAKAEATPGAANESQTTDRA